MSRMIVITSSVSIIYVNIFNYDVVCERNFNEKNRCKNPKRDSLKLEKFLYSIQEKHWYFFGIDFDSYPCVF